MTTSSSEVVSVVKDILKTSSKAAHILGVSEILFLTVLKDQTDRSIKKLSTSYVECDI